MSIFTDEELEHIKFLTGKSLKKNERSLNNIKFSFKDRGVKDKIKMNKSILEKIADEIGEDE